MTILEYLDRHTVQAFLWGWAALCIAWCAITLVRSMWIRLTRTIMVLARGWPPAHLDADGDWKPESSNEPKTYTIDVDLKGQQHMLTDGPATGAPK